MRAIWILLFSAAALLGADGTLLPMGEFVRDWQISKQFTLDVAEKMPEADYGFKATPAEMSFGGLMVHIAQSSVYRFAQMSGQKPPFKMQPAQTLTKAEILQMLSDSFDFVLRVLPQLTPEQFDREFKLDWKGRPEATGRAMALNMFVHVAHHRAQAEVYLRLKGITPPVYTF